MEWSSAGQVGGRASEGKGTSYGSPGYYGASSLKSKYIKQLERAGPPGPRADGNKVVGRPASYFRAGSRSMPHKLRPGCSRMLPGEREIGLSRKTSQDLLDPLALRSSFRRYF